MGRGGSFSNYAEEVELRYQVANLDPAKRASAPILKMGTVARRVCIPAGSDEIVDQEVMMRITQLLRDYFAPAAADAANQEVARFLQFERTGQTMDGYMARFDLLSRKAESKMQMGRDFPEVFASAPCMRNTPLAQPEESPGPASEQ